LLKELKEAGIKKISVSFLIIRPSIMNQFLTELPFSLSKEILRHYSGQPWQRVITSAKTKLLPKAMRVAGYRIFRVLANEYGIGCYLCGCKNSDLPWESCNPWINVEELGLKEKQVPLFA
jgi:hypothetical protein